MSSYEIDLLTDVNRLIGIAVTLVGALIVAPGGGRELASRLLWALVPRRVRVALARMLLWLHLMPATTRGRPARGRADLHINVGLSAEGRVWPKSGSVEDRIEALREHINDVEGKARDLDQRLRAETDARQEAIERVQQRLLGELRLLKQRLEEAESATDGTDARGLPVIAFGVILTGLPEELAHLPVHIGWFVLVVFAVYTVAAIIGTVRAHRTPRSVMPSTSTPEIASPPPSFVMPEP